MSKKAKRKDECKVLADGHQPMNRAILRTATTDRPVIGRRPNSLSRTILPLLLASAFWLLPSVSHAAYTITGLVNQVTSEALDTALSFHPSEDVLMLNNGLSGGPAKTIYSTNGGFSLSLDAGNYLVRLPLVPTRNPFTILVPHGTGTTDITNLIAAPWTFEDFENTIGGSSGPTNGLTQAQVSAAISSGTNTFNGPGLITNAQHSVAADLATVATSSTNWGTMESLLNPPHIGVPGTTGNYATSGNNSKFCYIAGSGIVRSLWCVPVISVEWTNVPTPNLSIQCYVDVGSNTNPPSAALKAWEIPIKDLMLWNYRFTSNGNYAVNFDSRFLSVADASTNILMGHPVRTFTLKTPIYFTNGILFRITNTVAANTTWSNGYFIASYEKGTLAGPYQNYRLRSLRYSGAISVGTSNHLGSIASGSGLIVGTLQSAVASIGSGDFVNFADSHGVRLTQGSTFWEMNGDDQFNSTYAMVRGPFSELDYGCPNVLYDTSGNPTLTMGAESYRWFYQDHMQFTNGFTSSVTPNGGLADYKFNLFYYAQ